MSEKNSTEETNVFNNSIDHSILFKCKWCIKLKKVVYHIGVIALTLRMVRNSDMHELLNHFHSPLTCIDTKRDHKFMTSNMNPNLWN